MDLLELVREKNFRLSAEAWTVYLRGVVYTILFSLPCALVVGSLGGWLMGHFAWRRLGLVSGAAFTIAALIVLIRNPRETAEGITALIDAGPRGLAEAKKTLASRIPEDEATISRGLEALDALAGGDYPDDIPEWLHGIGVVTKNKHGGFQISKRGEEILESREKM